MKVHSLVSQAPPRRAQRVVHRRSYGSWLLAGIVILSVGALLGTAVSSRVIDPRVFLDYLFSRQVLIGAGNSLLLGTVALALAGVVGLVGALMRVSGNPVLTTLASVYVWLFRGTPMLIQLIFWFNAFPTMFPRLHIAVPFTGAVLYDAPMTNVVTPWIAALIGLSLAEGAYMAEIIRGGIRAVDAGQRDAARAIGMRHGDVMKKVVIPQAARIILPAAGNQYILLLKSTSLASAIGYLELLRVATDIYSANFRVVELLTVAAFWFLVMTAVATALQMALERLYPHR